MKKVLLSIVFLLLFALPVIAQTGNDDVVGVSFGLGTQEIEITSIKIVNFIAGFGAFISFCAFIASFYFTVSLTKRKKQYLSQHTDVRQGEMGETDEIIKSKRHASILTFFICLLLVFLIPSGPIVEGMFKNGSIGFIVIGVLIVLCSIARILYAIRIRNFTGLARTGYADEHGELYSMIARLALWKRVRVASITLLLILLEVWAVVSIIT